MRDYWDKSDDTMLMRLHVRYRKLLFTPSDLDPEGQFCPEGAVEHRRSTKCTFQDGCVQHV